MSRITSVRSITRVPNVFSRLTPCTGDRGSSNSTRVPRASAIRPFSSSTLPCPRKKRDVGASRRWIVRPITWSPAVSARRASSSRCSSTWRASTLPLRGAPTSSARSIGVWISISDRIRRIPARGGSWEELLQGDVTRTVQPHFLVAQGRVEQHRPGESVTDLLSGDEGARARPEARPLEAHRQDDAAVVLRREVERPLEQRVAEVRALEIDPYA